jgi:hypothetical protein
MSLHSKCGDSAFFSSPHRGIELQVSRFSSGRSVALVDFKTTRQLTCAVITNDNCRVEQDDDGSWHLWIGSSTFEVLKADASEIATHLNCELLPAGAAK